MKYLNQTILPLAKTLMSSSLLILSCSASAGGFNSKIVDDFKHENTTNTGFQRVLISDTTAGGKTTTDVTVEDGVIKIKGDIVPPRGQPGWSSLVLPMASKGSVQDLSSYTGITLLVKVHQGNVSISANSAEVKNFDYHAAPVLVTNDGTFHQLNIPFESMKRAWSQQTKLNTTTIESLSIVAFGIQKTSFNFEIDDVSFY